MFRRFKTWRARKKAEKEKFRTQHEAATGFSPNAEEKKDNKIADLYLINNLWEFILRNLAMSVASWGRIPKDGAVDSFRSYSHNLYNYLKQLSEVLDKEIKYRNFSADIIITEEVEFLERMQALPVPLRHHATDVPQLAQKEKEISEKLREHHRNMLRGVKSSVDLFERKDRPINFIVVIKENLDYYFEHKNEYEAIVKEFKEIKENVDLLKRRFSGKIENYLKEKEEQFKLLHGKINSLYCYFFFHLFEPYSPPSLWQSSDPKRTMKERHFSHKSVFSSLGKNRTVILKELIPEIDHFLEMLKLKFNYFNENTSFKNLKIEIINLKDRLRNFIENDEKSFDLQNYLAKRVVSHFSKDNGLRRILYSGQIGSGKYLKDNKMMFEANSPRGIGSKPSWSIAFSLGAEEQYGQYGFIFDALTLIENKQFSLSTNTGGSDLFNEFYIFDTDFIPGIGSSPGASVPINKSYGIFPENGKYNKEVLEGFVENDFSLLGPSEIREISNLGITWLNSPEAKNWFSKNILFYNQQTFDKIRAKVREKYKHPLLGYFLWGTVKKKIKFSPPLNGKIMITSYQGYQGQTFATWQRDYYGPILTYVTDPNLKERYEAQVENLSQFTPITTSIKEFLKQCEEEIK